MSVAAPGGPAASRRNPFPANWTARIGWIALGAYTIYAASLFQLTWERFVIGLDNGVKFIGRMLPPLLGKWDLLGRGLSESLEIAIIATAVGSDPKDLDTAFDGVKLYSLDQNASDFDGAFAKTTVPLVEKAAVAAKILDGKVDTTGLFDGQYLK